MSTKERCIQLRDEGYTHREIAEIVGVSRQRVHQVCGRNTPGHFRPYSEEDIVYPNWRKVMNENKLTKSEFVRRMGLEVHHRSIGNLTLYMAGKHYPMKRTIDKILEVTGLTYEQLFSREDE